jgi:hypothetical protein
MSTEHLTHGHSATPGGRPVNSDVSFEKTDVRTSSILKFLVYLGIIVILSYLLAWGVYRGLQTYWSSTYTPPMPSQLDSAPTLPPEPRLQGIPGHLTDPQQDLRNKLKSDNDANSRFAWIDQKDGIAQIPVKDAMQLIVEKGLPAVPPPPAEKK